MAREALIPVESGTGSRSLLRRMNSLGILQAVLAKRGSTTELAARSGLSRTAVDSVVGDLLELGWISPIAASSNDVHRVGRPPTIYTIDQGLGCLVSIDIGANHVYVVVADLRGVELRRGTVLVSDRAGPARRITESLALADRVLNEAGLSRDDAWAVSVGSPGIVDGDGRVNYFGGVGMPDWVGIDLRERIGREFDAAVIVGRDVELGAEAEIMFGAAAGHFDVVYVLCGIRTSGAAIIGGKVHRGIHGAAGIVGEMQQLRWAELNETYASGILPNPRPSRETIFARALDGDSISQSAVDEFADALATGTAAMVLTLDPELVIIGGGTSTNAEAFLPRFSKTLADICPVAPPVVASMLGSEAVALGGISVGISHLNAVLGDSIQSLPSFPGPVAVRALLAQSAVSGKRMGAI